MTKFSSYINAGYPCLWVQTFEEQRAIEVLSSEVENYNIFSWDIVSGFTSYSNDKFKKNVQDPLQALNMIYSVPESSIIFMKDFHKFIQAVETYRTIKNMIPILKVTDKHIVFISPVVNIPIEVEKDITIMDFELPSVEELMKIAEEIIKGNDLNIKINNRAIESGKGLTLFEAENAMALSIVERKEISKDIMEKEKLQAIRKSGLMEIYNPCNPDELGGLNNLKKYIENRKKGFYDSNLPSPKGIILVGLPGAGKSLSSKVIASVLDFPLIRLDISSLKGSLVGESEQKMRQALSLIDAVSPCVVWIDEIEKALGGVQSSNRTDGGTTSSMFGYLLTWMQESKSKKYVVATCNDIDELLVISQGALIRRFDDVFFLDTPSLEERKDIIKIMNKKYGTNIDISLAYRMENWTGAEIEKFVISSIYDGIEDAFSNIKPIYYQNTDRIEKIREWAKDNARIANSILQDNNKKNRKINI